jgi:VanZ family protein
MSAPVRRIVVARWLAVLAWMALIFVLSAQPGLRVSADAAVDSPLRAMAHVVTFGVLGGLLAWALAPLAGSAVRVGLMALLIAAAYAVSDELHQSLVPDRTGQLDDVLLDVLGAALGIALAIAFAMAMSRRARRSRSVAASHRG